MARVVAIACAMLGALVLVGAIALVVRYPRQIVSHLTHWKGAPRTRVPYEPYVPAPTVRIAVAGDIGHAGAHLDATGAVIAQLGTSDPYDALLLLGDHAYPRGDPRQLQHTVFDPFATTLALGTELLAVLGNHDVLDGHGDAQLRALDQPGRWWAREFDNLVLVGIDSNPPVPAAGVELVERTLAAHPDCWRVVALHHPPYSAGYQGSDLATRERFAPVFARHGVHLVLSAHDHDYQRSVELDGVTYVVTGGAAHVRFTGVRPFTAAAYRVRHFVELAVFPDRLVVRAIDQHARVFDEVVLRTRAAASMRGGDRRAS
jgi:Calcineurin-like phosphoesterase